MWMMGSNDSSGFKMSDSFNGRRLRSLMPRPTSSTTTTHPSLSHIHGSDLFPLNTQLASITEQNKKEFSAHPSVSSRWNPTPEQLRALEDLYRRGTRTPTTEQIQHITAHLRRFGKIEGKNVFYWFQNHKARERQKRRRCLEFATAAAADKERQQYDIENFEKKDSGSSSTCYQVEPNRNWVPTTNGSKLAEESVSKQRAAVAESRAEGWVQFKGKELQQRPISAESHATWQMMHLSCSPPSHITKTKTNVNPQLIRKDRPMKNTEECGDSNVLQLFPLHDAADHCGDGAKKETKLSTQFMNSGFMPYQFFEFLPMKD